MKVIITGSTGMVGEGVLLECINNEHVTDILLLNRKHHPITDPKVKEIIVKDFMQAEGIQDALQGYDACFFCAGISSVGLKEDIYKHITYDITMHVAKILSTVNPAMTFIYVSGSGTDSSEKGKLMWARVKGKTENDLLQLPFKAVYNFRPGIMRSTPGQKNVKWGFKIIDALYPMLNFLFPAFVSTLQELALAMITVVITPYKSTTLEVKDIKKILI
ncbi:MAG: NAD-dependent epimerase/dehydratase family protein [Bacteroidota bacterium]|jgi:uncharacterized protein YbjT (DUF2867 family)|nr:NAD(P)H-binding protein [Chitinophagaceae bacterium]MCE2758133.1 NAD(P)H-binding protein [Chitinophagaceae bacterium]